MNQQPNQRLDLTFSSKFDSQQTYLLKVPKEFVQELDHTQQFCIEADPDQHVILSSEHKSYRMKGVNLSTSLLVLDSNGTIHKESDGYVQLEVFQPEYHLIYQKLYERSCHTLKKQQEGPEMEYQQLVENYGFSEEQFRKWSQLNHASFNKISEKLKFISTQHVGEEGKKYLYIPLPLAVEYMRNIITRLNEDKVPLFENLSYQQLATTVGGVSEKILDYLFEYFACLQITDEKGQKMWKLTPDSICCYIMSEMAVAKDQYTEQQFQQIFQDMLALYMPAQVDTQAQEIQGKIRQYRYNYFIEKQLTGAALNGIGGGSLYIFYDFMQIDTNLTNRLKFLAGFKKRYNQEELKAIFRGMDACQNGKNVQFSDILLKKFRKFGDSYEIKFILPK